MKPFIARTKAGKDIMVINYENDGDVYLCVDVDTRILHHYDILSTNEWTFVKFVGEPQ